MNISPLHDHHLKLGAKMMPFAGWEMPIQYDGIVAEHRAVRNSVGAFDISHMGALIVEGMAACDALNRLLTNDLCTLDVGQGQYTLMLNKGGGVIDDLIIYRLEKDNYFLVVNASKVDEDVEWLQAHLPKEVSLINLSESLGAIAVQGPDASLLWERLEGEKPLPGRNGILKHPDNLTLCRTGYTGEDGFELFAPEREIGTWFQRLLDAGAKPCGLGARDTLRLEKGFPLNGSDLDETHTPLEAGLGFFVKLDKVGGFIGQDVLLRQKQEGLKSRLVAVQMDGKAPPPRQGYEVRDAEGESSLGVLTSGSLSPGLGLGVGLAYLPIDVVAVGTPVTIVIRDRPHPATIVKKPFV